ncbi:MAG: UDP-2,3-diacylglucosamine diphosphatase [Planctomycetota bacterium JB042]
MTEAAPRRWRSIWLSDVHLGTRGCQAELLLEFLRHNRADRIYLVGDIIDFWAMRRGLYWPPSHGKLLQRFLELARRGTEVVYVPGNHDESLREYRGLTYQGLRIERTAVHEGPDGRRYLVLHGDEFDMVVKNMPWLSKIGDVGYSVLLWTNRWFNVGRRVLGLRYWSLSAYVKLRVKNAVQYISRFEELVAETARRRKFDGVICGHIHHAEIREIDGVAYMNDGDWVESNTALVETFAGDFEILRWNEERPHADPARDRRVAPAGERSDAHALAERDGARAPRPHRVGARP